MARPRNADGQRTRQAILDAALDLFGERGFFGTTLRDVAAAVGIRESAIYNYFPGKQALFEALIDAEQDVKRERIVAALTNRQAMPGRCWNGWRSAASTTSPTRGSGSCSAS